MFKNIELKLISVLIAISLWFVVLNGDVTQMKLYIPITLEHLAKGNVAITNVKLLNVEVKGSNFLLKNISHRDIVVSIDVSNFAVGKTSYKIKLTDIKTPKGISIVKIEPEHIQITIDKLITKKLEITPIFIGEPKEGFKVETVKTYPKKVEVVGPESILKNTDFIETLPINLSGKKKDIVYAIGLKKQEDYKSVTPEQIDVFVGFTEDIIEEKYENFPIEFINKQPSFKYKINPSEVKISLKGRKDRLDEKTIHKYLKLYVDLSTISKPGTYLRQINKLADSNIKLISVEPKSVRIEVSE
jgi:YbbR domain-containing protein